MQSFWSRILWRTSLVGVALAVFGYVLARAFLMVHRMYSGGAYIVENETVLWRTPLTMAALGMILTFALEFTIGSLRKPVKVPAGPSGS